MRGFDKVRFFHLCSINVTTPCTYIMSMYNLGFLEIIGTQWYSSLCSTYAGVGLIQRLTEVTGVVISNKDTKEWKSEVTCPKSLIKLCYLCTLTLPLQSSQLGY